MTRTEIVVGVDYSDESQAALDYAMAEAIRRGDRLRVIACYAYPEYTALGYAYPMVVTPAEIEANLGSSVQAMVDQTLAAQATPPATRVEVRRGPAGPMLTEQAAGADMLVVGHRGRGAVASRLLGSVGLHCVLHARCPVTVVRPYARDTAPERVTRQIAATATG